MADTTNSMHKVPKPQDKRGVRFGKVDDKDIDFVAEENKSQRRWSIVKAEKVSQGLD